MARRASAVGRHPARTHRPLKHMTGLLLSAAADACLLSASQLPPASMWHRFDFPAPVVQLGGGPHIFCHMLRRERRRGGRHPHQPQPPCVTIITRTDPRSLTLCALPIAIRAPRIGSAEPDLSYLREKQWMEKVKEIMSEKDINPLRQ